MYPDKNRTMNYYLNTSKILPAEINLPASKSISNRVLVLNALCNEPGKIHNLSNCDDTEVMVEALQNTTHEIDIKAAGTAMRFLTAFFSGKAGRWVISGTERMKNRPVGLLVDALHSLGARINYVEKEGFPPLCINGQTLKGGEVYLDGSISSQYISALLMIAPLMTNGLKLHLEGQVISTPYISLTIELMRQFGVAAAREGHTFIIQPQPYSAVENFTVESDWSAASYWYEMVALCVNEEAEVSLSGLWCDSLQGDASIALLFDKLGVKTKFSSSGITLTKKQSTCKSLTFDFLSMPDMAQTVAVTCAMLNIPFCFHGLQSLKIKETDRLSALCNELQKFGYLLKVQGEGTLEWEGDRCEPELRPAVETYDDHRMAMAFAPVAFCRKDGVIIKSPEVVSKSYPSYWDDLSKTGVTVIERTI